MNFRNNNERYGMVAALLHWGIALLIFVLLAMGAVMEDVPAPTKYVVYDLHKAVGMAVLILVGVRVLWRFMNVVPEHLATHKNWERKLSDVTQMAFYALMILVPLSGWAASSGFGHPPAFFGLFPFPPLIAENKEFGEVFGELHEVLTSLLWIAIGLHIAGALKHVIIDKDETLKRISLCKK